MKTKTIFISLLLIAALGSSKAQSLIELKKQIAETNYQKGNFYVSAFPVFSGHFGRPGTGFGFNVGHSFSFGYFLANRISLNFSTTQAFSYSRYFFSEYIQPYTQLYASPALSIRWYVLNKRCTPFIEAGFNNLLMYSESNIFDAFEGFNYSGSVFGGLGINIPISDFNFSLAAKYLIPVVGSHSATNYYTPYANGLQFEPRITWFFNKKRKELKETYKFY
jgi:hypothetical protein